MRELAQSHRAIIQQLEELQKKGIEQDEKIHLIFKYLKGLEEAKKKNQPTKVRPKIGYRK